MKKFASVFVGLLCCSMFSYAQQVKSTTKTTTQSEKEKIKTRIEKPSRDFVTLALTYDNWAGAAKNGVNISGIGRGFSGYLNYDFPISNSNFSFAAGLGISSNNVYFNKQLAIMNTSSDEVTFQTLDTVMAPYYKLSKLNTTYLEAPFELRYYSNKINRNQGFKMSVGVHVGTLMGAHTRVRHSAPGMTSIITEKVNTRRYIQSWRFAPVVRIGWGNFSIYGKYAISPVFDEGAGPTVFPYSIGISISGL